jgi:hypothetical protein
VATHLFETYQTLQALFQAEQLAFLEADTQKLAAIAPQIRKCCSKIAGLEENFSDLTPAQTRTAKQCICRLQEQVVRSRESWERYKAALEKERNLLQSSKRFVHQAKLEKSSRRPRISHSA